MPAHQNPIIDENKYFVYLSNIDTKETVLQNATVSREGLSTLMIYMLNLNASDIAMVIAHLDNPVPPHQIRWLSTNPNYPFEMLATTTGMI